MPRSASPRSEPPAPRAAAHVFVAASLDGFIARRDGGMDWLEVPGGAAEDHGYADFIARMDAILMGARTFRSLRDAPDWPFALPVLAMSRRAGGLAIPAALRGRVETCPLSPRAALEAAAARGWSRVQVDGGRLVQAFVAEGLVEELTVTRVPVLLGRGRQLFGPAPETRLRHVATRVFPSGLVQSRYRYEAS